MIAVGDRISTSTAAASGPIAALTAMLHERGIALETLSFHQMRSEEYTATFIRGTMGPRRVGNGLVQGSHPVSAARVDCLRQSALQ